MKSASNALRNDSVSGSGRNNAGFLRAVSISCTRAATCVAGTSKRVDVSGSAVVKITRPPARRNRSTVRRHSGEIHFTPGRISTR